MTSKVLIVATNGFEQSELMKPRQNLMDAGINVTIASPEQGAIRGWDQKDWGDTVSVDMSVEDASADDYDALLLPGGQMNPDILRMNDTVISLVRSFDAAGKPIAAICHAPWLLVEADIVRDRKTTSWPSVRTDLRNAGATVVDEECVVDGNLITSRNPDDIPAFSKALIEMLQGAESKVAEDA